jgi:hypothetical protein
MTYYSATEAGADGTKQASGSTRVELERRDWER